MKSIRKFLSLAAVAAFSAVFGAPSVSQAGSTTVVVSQVYGGGGNATSTYKNDFIELHNISNAAVSVAGWSVQYNSAAGTSNYQVTNLSGTIAAGGYYLVQESAGTGGTTNLPTPDASGGIAMSATAGKVALVDNTTALPGTSTSNAAHIVDFVGFGTTANVYEGSGQTPAPGNATAVTRGDNGSTDTDSNPTDFTAGAVVPHNSASATYIPGANKVRVETAANGSGTVVPAQALNSGSSLTTYSITRTAGDGFIANATATWSLTNKTGGVVDGDLVVAGDGKSATLTGHATGSAVIHVVASGLASVDSGVITVAGTSTQVRVETAAAGSGQTVPAQTIVPNSPTTVYSISRDASSAFVANAAATWSLTNKTGGVVDGDLVAAGDGKSAIFTGHANGSAVIHAVVNGLTSVDSGFVTVLASANKILVETAADGSGQVVSAQTISPNSSVATYAISRDANDVFVANAPATWSLINKTGGVADSDLYPSNDGKSAVFTGHGNGTAVIHAVINGLTSVNSNTITVSGSTNNPSAVASANSTTLVNGQNVSLTVTVTAGSNPTNTSFTVTGDLSAIGGSSTQVLTPGAGNTFTYQTSIPANLAGGFKLLNFTVTDGLSRTGTAALVLTVRGNLTIFHTNDTHARVTPHKWVIPQHSNNTTAVFEDVGGIAYMGAKVLSLAAGTPDALILDGGDISEGNPIGDWNGPGYPSGTYGDATIVDYYKMLDTKLKAIGARGGRGLDAMVVGNHDIRDITYINNMKAASAQFPILSMNICKHGTHTPYFQTYTIINLNGNKIGVVGYTTESADSPETEVNSLIDVVACDWSSADSTKIHFADIVNDLRNNQGCSMVILLTHMGHSGLCTVTGANPTPILVDTPAATLPEIVVSGHWHTYCDTVWQPTSLNYKTIFTEAGSFQHYVGELKVNGLGKYASSTYYPLRNSDITPDPDIAAYLQNRKDQYATTNPPYGVDQVIGYSSDDLLLDNYMKWWSADEYPWSGNNTAGNWICDAVQAKAAQLFGSCDLSVEAGGGVRSDIIAGPIKYTNIYETFPWPDDTIYVVHMTGQQIYDFFRDHNCDAALSSAWHVTAFDGNPTSITFNGQPVSLSHTYTVAINNYMYLHDTSQFNLIDPNPLTSTYLARTALFDYTSQFGAGNPYDAGASRYTLNTDFSGGYRAVITMMNDADTRESFKDGFIRFVSALPETLAHRGTQQVPADLVNADGTINRANRLSENEWYRSYLGFRTGVLHAGDIVEIWGKGAFFGGNPEFVDQEGIQSDSVEFKIAGHDDSLAQPTYFSTIAGFWNQTYKNHYVKFLAKKTSATTVGDKNGTTITVEDRTGYATQSLPGNVGDLLVLTGVTTSESFGLRFRCDTVVTAASAGFSDYPPDSHVNAVAAEQSAATLSLAATATVAPGSNSDFYSIEPIADAQVESGVPNSNFGGPTVTNIFIESASTGSFKNERGWLRFDLSTLPSNATITSAKLNMFCWKATGASMPASMHPADSDTWSETGITWNSQPTFGAALDTQTLVEAATNVWYTWDATSYAQTKFGGNKLVSLVVKAVTEDSTDPTAPSYGFDSRDYSGGTHPYLQIAVPSAGTPTSLSKVDFFYRFSADNLNWGSWTNFQTVTVAPYNATFNYPSGPGYYEFYSAGMDSNNNVEPAPPYGDTAVHFVPAITNAATNLLANGATAQGSFNPHGVQTSAYFEYGTDINYGYTTSSQNIGNGTEVVNFNAPITGLASGTLYHMRAVTVANGVTTYGADQTFTTPQSVPAMPGWAWITLSGVLVIVLTRRLPKQRAESVLNAS